MGKESVVEIPQGSGNHYRYEYQDGATKYRGPVGSAPEIGEEEFLAVVEREIHPAFYPATREEMNEWQRVDEDEWPKFSDLRRSGKLSKSIQWKNLRSYQFTDMYKYDEEGPKEWEWVKNHANRLQLFRYRGRGNTNPSIQDAYRSSKTVATHNVLQQPSKSNEVLTEKGLEPDFDWNWVQVEIVNGTGSQGDESIDDYLGHVYWWEEKGAYVWPWSKSRIYEGYDLVYVKGRYPGRE